MANYNFNIKYKSGKPNVDADALSQNPWDMHIDTAIIKSIMNYEGSNPLYGFYGPNTDLLHPEVVSAKGGQIANITPPELNLTNSTNMSRGMWIETQKEDPALDQLITLLKSKP